ncbi:MAG: hypothetical protein J5829_04755 [Lachnospiraceae bacterium]|nr:hypothetical protein [Lachnospiraceae bacterium]
MSNMLNDDQLSAVSGGATTSTGFEITKDGTVKFIDKTGVPMDISAADYEWLLGKYKGDTRRDQECDLATVNVSDIKSLLEQHRNGTLL